MSGCGGEGRAKEFAGRAGSEQESEQEEPGMAHGVIIQGCRKQGGSFQQPGQETFARPGFFACF